MEDPLKFQDEKQAKCPNCYNKAKELFDAEAATVADKYGKIDACEFVEEKKELDSKSPYKSFPENLRQLFGVEMGDGYITTRLKSSCNVCGYVFEYKRKVDVKSKMQTELLREKEKSAKED